jgi:hypothetical protein
MDYISTSTNESIVIRLDNEKIRQALILYEKIKELNVNKLYNYTK